MNICLCCSQLSQRSIVRASPYPSAVMCTPCCTQWQSVTGHTLLVSRLQVTFPLIIVTNVKQCDIYHSVLYLRHQCVAQLSVLKAFCKAAFRVSYIFMSSFDHLQKATENQSYHVWERESLVMDFQGEWVFSWSCCGWGVFHMTMWMCETAFCCLGVIRWGEGTGGEGKFKCKEWFPHLNVPHKQSNQWLCCCHSRKLMLHV